MCLSSARLFVCSDAKTLEKKTQASLSCSSVHPTHRKKGRKSFVFVCLYACLLVCGDAKTLKKTKVALCQSIFSAKATEGRKGAKDLQCDCPFVRMSVCGDAETLEEETPAPLSVCLLLTYPKKESTCNVTVRLSVCPCEVMQRRLTKRHEHHSPSVIVSLTPNKEGRALKTCDETIRLPVCPCVVM